MRLADSSRVRKELGQCRCRTYLKREKTIHKYDLSGLMSQPALSALSVCHASLFSRPIKSKNVFLLIGVDSEIFNNSNEYSKHYINTYAEDCVLGPIHIYSISIL